MSEHLSKWTLATDENGDLRFSDHSKRFETVRGVNAVAQDLRVALSTHEGEDPIDGEFGMDIFTATNSALHLEREIRRTLLHDDHRHDRVEAVTDVQVDIPPGSRDASVIAEVQLASDEVEVIVFDISGLV